MADDEDWSGSDLDEDDEDEDLAGLTTNQKRLLYLISLHSHPAQSMDDEERWVRDIPMMVLIYEGIVMQVFDFDYAPASKFVNGKRIYFNTSQEGRSDIDFLREEELVNGLKMTSAYLLPVTAYQVSEKGLKLLGKVRKADKEAVHDLAYAPQSRDLLRPTWHVSEHEEEEEEWEGNKLHGKEEAKNIGEFYLEVAADAATQFEPRLSSVTDTEDVSYVSSAYVPQCLRDGGRPTMSNAHRAHECGSADSGLRDDLDEVITLNSVSIIVSEYVPCGSNQIVALNANLGSMDRVQGGLYSDIIDSKEGDANFSVPVGLTSVNILDFHPTRHVNIEAEIHEPVSDGVVQVETFGISVSHMGTMFYGMQIEAVMNRIKDNISIDHLARLLVDVHKDSSGIVDSITAAHQNELMDVVFVGDRHNRPKFNLIIANEITPHLTAEEYMDKGEYENELKQVIGDTRSAFDISEHDTLVFGEDGILVAGPNSRHHEPLLCSFMALSGMEVFVRSVFRRSFIMLRDMENLDHSIRTSARDPDTANANAEAMERLTNHLILLNEVVESLMEGFESIIVPSEPPEQAGRSLYERLAIPALKSDVALRINDLRKIVASAQQKIALLEKMYDRVLANAREQTQVDLVTHTQTLARIEKVNERSRRAVEVTQVLLAGLLAFAICDRVTGDWSVMEMQGASATEKGTDMWWTTDMKYYLMEQAPGAWFVINMLVWVVIATAVVVSLKIVAYRFNGKMYLRWRINRAFSVKKFKLYLTRKRKGSKCKIVEERRLYSREWTGARQQDGDLVSISWMPPKMKTSWGCKCTITAIFDETHERLIEISVEYPRRQTGKLRFNGTELKIRLEAELKTAGVFALAETVDNGSKAATKLANVH
jgi:WD repeat-containing protein 35